MAKRSTLSDALHSHQAEKPQTSRKSTGGERRQLSIRLEPEVITQLKILAVQEDTTLQDLVCEGLNQVFKSRGKPALAK